MPFSTPSNLRGDGIKIRKPFGGKSGAANSRRPELVADYWSPGWKSNGRNMVASATELLIPPPYHGASMSRLDSGEVLRRFFVETAPEATH